MKNMNNFSSLCEICAPTSFVTTYLDESISVLEKVAANQEFVELIVQMARAIEVAMRSGHKLLIAGNGGSAGDAQHLAAEFTGRFAFDRPPLPAIALTTDTSAITAIGNDYDFDAIFSRQLQALASAGDVFLGISTSGNSRNVLRAAEMARELHLTVIGLTGRNGGSLSAFCDLLLAVPSSRTALVQQIHITAGHLICGLVEQNIFSSNNRP